MGIKRKFKTLKNLIDEFESQYSHTIDKCMYNIFCNEVKNIKKIRKKERTKKTEKNIIPHTQFLSKKRNIESFNENELKDPYLNELKKYLHIKVDKNHSVNFKNKEENLFIDLREKTKENEVKLDNSLEKETIGNSLEENRQSIPKLIKPKVV